MVKVCILWEVVDLRTHSSLHSWDIRGKTAVTRHNKRQELITAALREREQQISSREANWLTPQHRHICARKILLFTPSIQYVPGDKLQHIGREQVNGSSSRRWGLVTSHTVHVQVQYIQVCRHTGRQIGTRWGLACRQTDEWRDARMYDDDSTPLLLMDGL